MFRCQLYLGLETFFLVKEVKTYLCSAHLYVCSNLFGTRIVQKICPWKLGLGLCDLLGIIADTLLKVQILSFDLTVLKWLLYILFISFSISYIFYFYSFSYHIKAVTYYKS